MPTADALTTTAQIASAVAAAAAAIASWRSASAALLTSRETAEALALALEPDLNFFAKDGCLYLINGTQSEIVDVVCEGWHNGRQVFVEKRASVGAYRPSSRIPPYDLERGIGQWIWQLDTDLTKHSVSRIITDLSDSRRAGRWRANAVPAPIGVFVTVGETHWTGEMHLLGRPPRHRSPTTRGDRQRPSKRSPGPS